MNNVEFIQEKINQSINHDFQKQNIKFDIVKLRAALDQILKIKGLILV